MLHTVLIQYLQCVNLKLSYLSQFLFKVRYAKACVQFFRCIKLGEGLSHHPPFLRYTHPTNRPLLSTPPSLSPTFPPWLALSHTFDGAENTSLNSAVGRQQEMWLSAGGKEKEWGEGEEEVGVNKQ